MSVSPGKWVYDRIYKNGNYEKGSLDFFVIIEPRDSLHIRLDNAIPRCVRS